MSELLYGIGAVARASGLPVSALRYYDAAGVLRPAWSDPGTGYRWYRSDQVEQARLVVLLREAELPVASIIEVLVNRHRPGTARAVLSEHLSALQERLARSSALIEAADGLLADPPATRFEVDRAELARAVGAVRYAVAAADPVWPALSGVLLHCAGGLLRLVACDRARLAVTSVAVRGLTGPEVQVVVPPAALEALPDDADDLTVELRIDRLVLAAGAGRPVVTEPLAGDYPDYRALLEAGGEHGVCAPTADLQERLAGGVIGPDAHLVAVRLSDHGVDVVRPATPGAVVFDRTYLLQALAAAGGDEVALSLDAVRGTLAVVPPDRPDDRNLLMPVRLRSGGSR